MSTFVKFVLLYFLLCYMLGYTAVAVVTGIIYSMAGEAHLFVSWHELVYRCYFQTETNPYQ